LNKARKKSNDATVATPGEAKEAPKVTIKLYDEGSHNDLSQKTFGELISNIGSFQKLKFAVLSLEYDVVYNHPWINLMLLPTSILAGFYVYPSKLELQFAEKSYCEFAWFRGKTPKNGKEEDIEWQQVEGSDFQYLAQPEDVGHRLKVQCVPKNAAQVGPALEAISKNAVEAGPGVCPFEMRHSFTRDKCSGREFRVVSYNILADLYCDSDYTRKELFPYCPPYALNIDYRKQLFMKEIVGYNGDVVALQEVDSKIFDLDLQPMLNVLNYEGFFKVKGTTAEGLATFWNTERFLLSDSYGINIGENIPILPVFEPLWQKIKTNPSLVTRVTERSTAVSVVVLKSKELKDKHLIVANTHLYFHPDADHVRLLQIGFSMLYVQDKVEETKKKYGLDDKDVALVFCGDFNSVPDCGIYKLMTEKFVPEDFVDWQSSKLTTMSLFVEILNLFTFQTKKKQSETLLYRSLST
jgi:2',5'-phosphodiesterase